MSILWLPLLLLRMLFHSTLQRCLESRRLIYFSLIAAFDLRGELPFFIASDLFLYNWCYSLQHKATIHRHTRSLNEAYAKSSGQESMTLSAASSNSFHHVYEFMFPPFSFQYFNGYPECISGIKPQSKSSRTGLFRFSQSALFSSSFALFPSST